ncbi:MAG: hypothetical protein GX200_04065 [Firmicutes bacterium]|nr:hypothetical protein [Bacillota bacterium]
MLTKKQLEKAVVCHQFDLCYGCPLRTVPHKCLFEHTAYTALKYREMLERIQYVSMENGKCCPVCGAPQGSGHIESCELAVLLADSGDR